MAKQSGLGDNCYVDSFDLSGDIGSLSRISNARAATDVTAINKSANERLLLAKDGNIEFSSWFNPTITVQEHAVLKTLPTTDRIVSYYRGTTLGNVAASMVGKQINYDPTRGADGSLSFGIQAQSNGFGLEWGRMLTAGKLLDQSAGSLSGLDYGAVPGTTAFGLQAYMHVFDIGSGTANVVIQDSNDNGGGDPYVTVTGASFSGVSAAGAQRIQTARNQTVKRWLRVNISGTFTLLDFAVMVVKNEVDTQF